MLVTLVVHRAGRDRLQPAWRPPALTTVADDPQELRFPARKLARSQTFHTQFEHRHEQSSTLLNTINAEIARSRAIIAEQNQELKRLQRRRDRLVLRRPAASLVVSPGGRRATIQTPCSAVSRRGEGP